jgi:YbgC/YbaW family acyl-CoA thioester hydrolase
MDNFGHVNNSCYLTYLEEARDEYLTGLLGAETVHRIVVRRTDIEFVSGLSQDDDTAIASTEVEGLGTSSIRLRESIHAGSDGRLAARAQTVVVHTASDGREASAPLPDEARQILERELERATEAPA